MFREPLKLFQFVRQKQSTETTSAAAAGCRGLYGGFQYFFGGVWTLCWEETACRLIRQPGDSWEVSWCPNEPVCLSESLNVNERSSELMSFRDGSGLAILKCLRIMFRLFAQSCKSFNTFCSSASETLACFYLQSDVYFAFLRLQLSVCFCSCCLWQDCLVKSWAEEQVNRCPEITCTCRYRPDVIWRFLVFKWHV